MDLNTLILFVTSRCNARCETCFYWEELNRPGDLTFEEIEALSAGMPRFHELWLSGGEPMMRPRLAEILGMFYHRNGVRTLNLPTNGLFAREDLGADGAYLPGTARDGGESEPGAGRVRLDS